MALGTYQELSESIQAWLAETSTAVDLAARIPDFIALLESELNANPEFRLLEQQKAQQTVPNDGDDQIDLPTGYLEMDYLRVSGVTPSPPLEFRPPRQLVSTNLNANALVAYTIQDQRIWLSQAMDGTQTLEMGFYVVIPPLNETDNTNWLLTKSPTTYLFGSLGHAVEYLQDIGVEVPAAIANRWEGKTNKAIGSLIAANKTAVRSRGAKIVNLPVRVA